MYSNKEFVHHIGKKTIIKMGIVGSLVVPSNTNLTGVSFPVRITTSPGVEKNKCLRTTNFPPE